MAIKTLIVATVMFAGFALAFYTLTPVYFGIRTSMNSTAVSILTGNTQAQTQLSNVVGIFGYLWAWVAALGIAFILIWAYTHMTKRDYESVQNP